MSVTSPLTSYVSSSTPRSYETAPNSPSHDQDTTGISSPDADAETYETAAPHFRRAAQPANELKNQCQIHFEEDLCNNSPHPLLPSHPAHPLTPPDSPP